MENFNNIDVSKFEKKIARSNINNISNIGQELKFQREFYNFLNPSQKLVLKSENEETSYNLGKEIAKFIEKLTGEKIQVNNKNVPTGLSYDVLNNIEKNNIIDNNGHKPVYSLDIYYDKIFYMFKLYGFIKEDYDIFSLLNIYGICPTASKRDSINEIIDKCNKNYSETLKNSSFNIATGGIFAFPEDIRYLIENDSNFTFLYNNEDYNFLLEHIDKPFAVIKFKDFRKIVISKFSKLSNIERKCLSLFLGQNTSFIDDILHYKTNVITLYTLEKILNYLELKHTDLYYLMKKRKEKNSQFNIKEVSIPKLPKQKLFN